MSSSQLTVHRGHAPPVAAERAGPTAPGPHGLGSGNGVGVDVSDAFAAIMPRDTPEQEVVRTLQAADFVILPTTGPDGERAMTATKDLDSSAGTRTWTMAIVRLHAAGGEQRLSGIKASLTWSAP